MSDAKGPPVPTKTAPDAPTAAAGDPALGRAAEILRGAGARFRALSRLGSSADVLAVDADPAELGCVRACAPQVRGLGFRYIAIELRAEGPRSHDRTDRVYQVNPLQG
jgi:hypothetical protein